MHQKRYRIRSLIYYKLMSLPTCEMSEMSATCLQRICRIPAKTCRMLDKKFSAKADLKIHASNMHRIRSLIH